MKTLSAPSKFPANPALVTLLALLLPLASSAREARTTTQIAQQLKAGKETIRIACFGDSITGVYYHTGSARAWTDMLGIALKKAYPAAKLEMINAGISGHTTVNALARIEKDVIKKNPDLVVTMFGMNDVTRVDIDDYEKNMRHIVEKCRGAGAAILLCTPNSVFENPARPNATLAAYSDRVRNIGRELKVPVVDFFKDWSDLRREDETAWRLLMSETIHPNLNGHKRFASLITRSLSGQDISLEKIDPAPDPLHNTRELLRAGQTLKLVAMPPFDEALPAALKKKFPAARIEVTPWPAKDQSLAEMREWSKKIRKTPPNLVVLNPPPAALSQPGTNDFIDDFQWILNYCIHFSKRQWDLVTFLPAAGTIPAERLSLAREALSGKDLATDLTSESIDSLLGSAEK